jgi:hypothetical protein
MAVGDSIASITYPVHEIQKERNNNAKYTALIGSFTPISNVLARYRLCLNHCSHLWLNRGNFSPGDDLRNLSQNRKSSYTRCTS